MILFETPISKTKVRNGVSAYRYKTGIIVINNEKFVMYTIKEAIKLWRRKNPI